MIPRFWITLAIVCVVCLTGTAHTCCGRQVADWDYQRLAERSDVIIIGQYVSSDDVAFDFSTVEPWASLLKFPKVGQRIFNSLAARVATFKIEAVLKGSIDGKQFKVLHFAFKEDPSDLETGPYFFGEAIETTTEATETDRPKMYILFLKKGKHGYFEPVTGQTDGAYSVRALQRFDGLNTRTAHP